MTQGDLVSPTVLNIMVDTSVIFEVFAPRSHSTVLVGRLFNRNFFNVHMTAAFQA